MTEESLFGTTESPPVIARHDRGAAGKHSAALPILKPLAERMRPQTLDEVIGQKKLLGPGAPLRVAFENRRPHSMILWGPPGVGKTTIARLMANAFDLPFIAISAVLGGVKDIREAVDAAKQTLAATQRPTVVFVDEVHRFSKSQQDAFLPHVESGLFIFVGATTENPSFEVVNALLSRATVYQLESLSKEETGELIDRAMTREFSELTLNPEARGILIELADGDARRCLNALDVCCTMARERRIGTIDAAFLRKTTPATLRRFDKGGDNFYDQISALHKSVRGSDPDAALYWLMRMLDGGDNPLRVQIGSNNIRAHVGDFIFTSKLVDGRFPDYRRVLPKNPDKHLEAGCDLLKQAFARAAILSNEKFRGVRLYVSENQLKITANNPEQEEAEEILDVTYSGAEMEIGFNVSYVLDVLNALKCENVRMMLTDSVSSVQIEDAARQSAAYVVMPMRL